VVIDLLCLVTERLLTARGKSVDSSETSNGDRTSSTRVKSEFHRRLPLSKRGTNLIPEQSASEKQDAQGIYKKPNKPKNEVSGVHNLLVRFTGEVVVLGYYNFYFAFPLTLHCV